VSWKASAFVRELTTHKDGTPLTAREKLILFVLADAHNADYGYAWLSIPKAAKAALTSPRRFMELIKRLEQRGTVRIERTQGRSNHYSFPDLPVQFSQGSKTGNRTPPVRELSHPTRAVAIAPEPHLNGTVTDTTGSSSQHGLIDILQTLESHGTVIIERRGTNTHLYRFPLVKPLHQQVAGEFTSAGEVRVHHPGEVRVHHPGEVASSPKPPLAANEPPVEREVRRVFETPEFRRFWDAYPNKLDREDAFREWMRYGWGDKDVETILAGLARWKLCEQWIENERFIPRASKFIRNRQWEINTPRKAESKSEKRQRKTSEAFDRIRKNSGANTHVD
jgi:hypothetical protein